MRRRGEGGVGNDGTNPEEREREGTNLRRGKEEIGERRKEALGR